MYQIFRKLFLAASLIAAPLTITQTAIAGDSKDKLVEIFHVAPGQHEAFLRHIQLVDEVNIMAGLPPRELYVHSNGNGWDYMLIQPAHVPDDKRDALNAAWEKLGLPSGINYFIEFRKLISNHEDTFVTGPITAKEYLSGIDKSKKTNFYSTK